VTVDETAKAADRAFNDVRAMELTLLAAGHSRTEARARINKIKGTSDSAPEASTSDSAGASELVGDLAGLLNNLKAKPGSTPAA
jgi:ATP-dependent Clp protease protease subunit